MIVEAQAKMAKGDKKGSYRVNYFQQWQNFGEGAVFYFSLAHMQLSYPYLTVRCSSTSTYGIILTLRNSLSK